MRRLIAVGIGLPALALLALLAVRRWCTLATVRGHSMLPTLRDGQRVLATRRPRYRAGDVILFWVPVGSGTANDPDFRVKRVVATAGQRRPAIFDGSRLASPIPAGYLAVVGDNPGHSEDSRQLGYISLRDVRGRVRIG